MSNKAAMRWHGVSMFLKFHVLILIVQVLPTSSEILTYAETHIFFAQDAPSEDTKNTHGHCGPLLELWLLHEAGSSTCLGIHRNGTVLWSRCKKTPLSLVIGHAFPNVWWFCSGTLDHTFQKAQENGQTPNFQQTWSIYDTAHVRLVQNYVSQTWRRNTKHIPNMIIMDFLKEPPKNKQYSL
jgi:hypothetical protein